MKNETVNIAVIGCGRIAGHHCKSIVQTEGAQLIAVCDLVPEKAHAYHKEFGVKAYDNYHQMLIENPHIDTVAIITPSGMHYEHTMDIISHHRKNVVIEKPTFMKTSHVKAAYAKAEEVGVQIFAVFQNRYNLAVQHVLRGLTNGELGALRSAAVRVRWCRPQRYYDLSQWRGTFSMDGGCLANQGVHHIDLLRLMGGEIKRVCGINRTLGANIEVEDTVTATIEFKGGAVGTLEVTTAARPIDYEASLSFVCENGVALVGGIAVGELQIYTPDPSACTKYSEDFSKCVYGNGHGKIYKEIVAALKKDQKFPVTYKDALASIQLLNAFYISDETQGWVDVSAAGDSNRLGRLDDKLANIYRTKLPQPPPLN